MRGKCLGCAFKRTGKAHVKQEMRLKWGSAHWCCGSCAMATCGYPGWYEHGARCDKELYEGPEKQGPEGEVRKVREKLVSYAQSWSPTSVWDHAEAAQEPAVKRRRAENAFVTDAMDSD